MGTDGENFRDEMDDYIDSEGTSVTITPRVASSAGRGGYEGRSYTEGTAVETKTIPSRNVTGRAGEVIGKVQGGGLRLVFKYSETIDEYSKITYQGNDYDVEDIDPVYTDDVLVAKRLTLKRELN